MWKNFSLTSVRILKRNISFSILNIGGLALGIATCIVMLLFVHHENQFDHMHQKGDRIFRLTEVQKFDGSPEQTVALSMYPMTAALKKDYPEVENTVRIDPHPNQTVRVGGKLFELPQVLMADSGFLQLFDFPLMEGNKTSALEGVHNIIITRTTAQKLFGRTNIVGQTLELYQDDGFQPFIISAVAEDVPDNSHIQFDAVAPLSSQKMQQWMDSWDANWVNTYVLLKENSSVVKLRQDMPSFLQKYLSKEGASHYELGWQPVFDIHLGSENITHDQLNDKKFSRGYVKIFLVIALFVLLIALFNFVNLSTARASKRAREVGIRKTIGAGYGQLVKQFTGEAIFFVFLALILALGLIQLCLPFISSIIQRKISLGLFLDPKMLLAFLAFGLLLGAIAGIYPALFISNYQPVKVLKGFVTRPAATNWSLRNVLVTLQFSIAIILIVSTLLIVRQLNYIKNRDIGFDKEGVLVLPMNKTANDQYEVFRNELLKNSKILDVTAYNQRLGKNINQMGADYMTKNGEKKHVSVSHLSVDYDYLNFYHLRLLNGRNFSRELHDDKGRSYIINETLAKELDAKNPVGAAFGGSWLKDMGQVVGVVKDFNFNSLHEKIAPLYISIQGWDYNEMSVKLAPGHFNEAINYIKRKWSSYIPDLPFSYSFLDDHLNQLYDTDRRVSKVVSVCTLLAVVIACLGLFGIVLFNIETRTKEIGIRKVLGATVFQISGLLSVEFLRPVFLALLIAFPLAWLLMNKWLNDFAYRIPLGWKVFAVSGIASLAIALFTINVQTLRAAGASPVKNLRTE
ncbi:MAG: ABC transporter permease [Flavisolibacter sp.]